MKKVLSVVCAAITAALVLGSCASSSGKLYGADQARAGSRPGWAQANTTFNTKEAEDFDARKLSESGLYCSGFSENMGNIRVTSNAASLSARTNLASYIAAQISANISRTDSNTGELITELTQDEKQLVNSNLKGTRVIDTYTEANGDMYVLMFVSNDNLKTCYSGTKLESIVNDYLASQLVPVTDAEPSASFE